MWKNWIELNFIGQNQLNKLIFHKMLLIYSATNSDPSILFSICRPQAEDSQENSGKAISDNDPVICEANDSFMCSLALDTTASFVTSATVSVSSAVAPPVLLRVPARPGKNVIKCSDTVCSNSF